MKLYLSSILSFFLFIVAQAQNGSVEVASKIEAVTVFLNGAQVSRTAQVSIPSGVTTLYFNEITQYMDPNSIQLTGKGNLTVLSISQKRNYLKPDDKSDILIELEKQIEKIQYSLDKNQASLDALTAEKEMIKANQQIGGQSGVSLSQLQQTATFFRTRLEEISVAWLDEQQKRKTLDADKRKLQQQLNVERAAYAQKTSQVIVKVEAKSATKAQFELKYLVNNASWSTNYDARVENLNSSLKLTQKATISQNTGENWNNVNLTLSTGNPSQGGQVPFMGTWYVDYYSARKYHIQGSRAKALTQNANTIAADNVEMEEASIGNQQFIVSENLTQEEYRVERRQTITSSGSAETVVLRELTLPAKYEYHLKPRIDKDAFLIAKVYDWEQYDLLSGSLSLFNQDTYVGKAYLNTQNPEDTLQLSLGRDNDIVVSRNRIRSKEEKSFLGSNKVELYTWKIEVRNTKKSSVNLLMKEPVPVSRNEEIKVSLEELSGGKLEEKSGIVRWRFSLAPGQNKEFTVSYEVKYPKDKQISLY